ncbi:hypothetical protein ACSBR2_039447 [Camellia fascicularis]
MSLTIDFMEKSSFFKNNNSVAPSLGTPETTLNNFESNVGKNLIRVIMSIVIGGVCVALVAGIVIFYLYRGRIKCSSKHHVIVVESMVIPIHVLKNATNNFSQENILGEVDLELSTKESCMVALRLQL